MKKVAAIGILILFALVSVKALSIGQDIDLGYKVVSVAGNESCWASVNMNGEYNEQFNIRVKQTSNRFCEICDDKENCQKVLINPPAFLPIFNDKKINIANITNNLNNYNFNVDPSLRRLMRFIKLGFQSIVIAGDNRYNSTDTNITQEATFAHLAINIANDSTNPYKSLVGYWNFDQDNSGTGAIAYDLSNLSNDGSYGTPYESVVCDSTAWLGCAYKFNSSSLDITQGINLGTTKSTLYLGTGNFTLSVWVVKNLSAGEGVIKRGLATSAAGNSQQYILTTTANGAVTFTIGNGTNNNALTSSQNVVSTTKWTYVTARINSSGAMAIFINGVQNVTLQKTIIGTAKDNQTYIGKTATTLGSTRGSIDEVMIFNDSLTDQQISDIYNNQSARFYPSGEMLFNNINLQGNNTLNVSINYSSTLSTLFNSSLGVRFNNGNVTYFVNGSISNYLVPGDLSNVNMTIVLLAGNGSTSPFYTPYLFKNITLTSFNVSATVVSVDQSGGSYDIFPLKNITVEYKHRMTNSKTESIIVRTFSNDRPIDVDIISINYSEAYLPSSSLKRMDLGVYRTEITPSNNQTSPIYFTISASKFQNTISKSYKIEIVNWIDYLSDLAGQGLNYLATGNPIIGGIVVVGILILLFYGKRDSEEKDKK